MPTDLILNSTTGDLDISGSSLKVYSKEQDASRQRLTIALQKNKGEWFLDVNDGVPYIQDILSAKGTKNLADSLIKQEILGTENIESITTFSSSLDDYTREYVFSFQAITSSGEIVSINNLDIFGG